MFNIKPQSPKSRPKPLVSKTKKYLSSITTILYLTVTLGSGVLPVANAFADETKADSAKSNQQEMLKVALGKEGNAFDKNKTDQDAKDLDYQTLGVYLSNFFIPYQTSFSNELGSGNKVQVDKDMQNNMTQALKKLTSMSDDVITNIISRTLGNMVDPNSSGQGQKPERLYFGKGVSYSGSGGTATSSPAPDKVIPANYYDFLALLLGDNETIRDIKDRLNAKSSDTVTLYWGNEKKVGFTFSLDPDKPTPSQKVMSVIYKNASVKDTISNAFLGDGEVKNEKPTKDGVQKLYDQSMYGWKMYEDTYGNLLVDNGKKRTVIMPAIMNPMIYTKTNISDSGDKQVVSLKTSYGQDTAVPLNNIQGMQYINNGDITKSGNGSEVHLTNSKWFDNISHKQGSNKFWFIPTDGNSLSSKLDYNVISLSTKKANDTKGNTVWGTKSSSSNSVDREDFNYSYNGSQNYLDQITYKHYMEVWNKTNSQYSAIGNYSGEQQGGDKSPVFIGGSLLVTDIKDILPTSARSVIVRTDTLKGLKAGKEQNKEWSIATGHNAQGKELEGINLDTFILDEKPQILNLTDEKQVNSSYGNTGYNKVMNWLVRADSRNRYQNDNTPISNNDLSFAKYPFRINFTQPSTDNYVVIPKSQLPSTSKDNGIKELFDTSDSGGVSENLAGAFHSVFDDKNSYVKDIVGKAGKPTTDTNKTLQSDLPAKIDKEAGLKLFITILLESQAPRNGTDEVKKGLAPEYAMGFTNTPKFSQQTAVVTNSKDSKSGDQISVKKANELMDLSFNFLDPVGGAKFIATWLSNKMVAITYDLHSRITGSNSSSYFTGATQYKENNGFVYQPKMEDTGFTASIKNNYNKWAIYLIIIMFMAIALYVIRGDFSIQKGILQFLIFCVFISIPIKMTDTIIGTSNQISSSFFTKKFNYFAVFQLENSALQIEKDVNQSNSGTGVVASSDDKKDSKDSKKSGSNLEVVNLDKISKDSDEEEYENAVTNKSNNENASGVSLRWMAPRKDNYSGYFKQAMTSSLDMSNFMTGLVNNSANKGMSHQSILGTAGNLYITRQLSDISANSRVIYNNVLGKSEQNHPVDSYGNVLANSDGTLARPIKNYLEGNDDSTNNFKEKNGFVNKSNNKQNGFDNTHKHALGAISSLSVAQATKQQIRGTQITPNTSFGVASDQFNATKEAYAKDATAFQDRINQSGDKDATSKDETKASANKNLNATTVAGTGMFSLYSESPFYHFSWALMDYGMASDFKTSGSMKNLMLGDEKGKSNFFFNQTISKSEPGYNELKDFSDLSTLFNVTIPYLHKLNQQYQDFVDQYGLQMYEHIPLTGPQANNIKQSDPDYYKYWYNYNLSRLQNQYTAWVDFMYAADYANPETIKYSGKTITVTDPLDPQSYLAKDSNGKVHGRPMIFSQSEMAYYGLDESNLTKVEQKILKYNENTRNALLPLMNYYTFHDSTMTTMTAITELFEFNKVFSQTGLFGSKGQLTMEPQSWSTSDFSYDAYLRLILANSTGESINFIKGSNDQSNKNQGSYDIEAGKSIDQQDLGVSVNGENNEIQVNGNIYQRILAKSNWFIGILMVISDIVTIYILTLLRYLFLIGVLILSVLILVTLILTTEANLKSLVKKSIMMPLLKIVTANIAFAFIISRFLSNGINTVTGDLDSTISLGVGATIMALLVLEVLLMFLYYNVIRKMIQDILNIGQVATNSVRYVASVASGVATSSLTGNAGILTRVKSNFNPRGMQSSDISQEDLYGSKSPRNSDKGTQGSYGKQPGSNTGTPNRSFGSKPRNSNQDYTNNQSDSGLTDFEQALSRGEQNTNNPNNVGADSNMNKPPQRSSQVIPEQPSSAQQGSRPTFGTPSTPTSSPKPDSTQPSTKTGGSSLSDMLKRGRGKSDNNGNKD